MSNIHELRPTSGLAPTAELQAQYLEDIAESIRSGETQIDRAIVVMAMKEGGVVADIFGNPTNVMESVGLLYIAATNLTMNPGGEG